MLSPSFGSSDLNFLRAAVLPFSEAYFPTLARCPSLEVVYFRRFDEGCWLLCSSRTRRTALLASFVVTAPIPVSSGVGREETGLLETDGHLYLFACGLVCTRVAGMT